MGYYSTMEPAFRLRKEAEGEILMKLKELAEKGEEWAKYYEDMQINDGFVEFKEEHRKNYYTDELACFLAPYVEGEGTLQFKGEDGDIWGYMFAGGKAYRVVYEMRKDEEVKACLGKRRGDLNG